MLQLVVEHDCCQVMYMHPRALLDTHGRAHILNVNLHLLRTRSLSSDTTKMQEAIQSGDIGLVNALLQEMTNTQQKAQLCATYGGSNNPPDYLDQNHLHVRTSPMLHAALSGNSDAFSVLLRYTRAMLQPQVGEEGSLLVKNLSSSYTQILAQAWLQLFGYSSSIGGL